MKHTIVRYKVRPEQVDENRRLVEAVFRELQEGRPEQLRYLSLTHGDGAFLHLVATQTGDTTVLTGLAAFDTFRDGIERRCLELPQAAEASIIGNYRMLGDSDDSLLR